MAHRTIQVKVDPDNTFDENERFWSLALFDQSGQPFSPGGGGAGSPGEDGEDGVDGVDGTTLNFRGDYDPGLSYQDNDVVVFDGSSYRAIGTINPGDDPTVTPDFVVEPVLNGSYSALVMTAGVPMAQRNPQAARFISPGSPSFYVVNAPSGTLLTFSGHIRHFWVGTKGGAQVNYPNVGNPTITVPNGQSGVLIEYWSEDPDLTVNGVGIVNPAEVGRWAVLALKGEDGGVSSRQSVVEIVSAEGEIDLGSAFAYAMFIEASGPGRLRFYASDAYRDADAARLVSQPPVGDHGLLLEMVFTNNQAFYSLTPAVSLWVADPTATLVPYLADETLVSFELTFLPILEGPV